MKSNTGISPFAIGYDEFGIAQGLATGSGFWGVQPGITMLLPSDPAVIYGGFSYLYQIPRNINRTVNSILIGEVKPGGDTIGQHRVRLLDQPALLLLARDTATAISSRRAPSSTAACKIVVAPDRHAGFRHVLSASPPRQSVNFAFQFGVTQDAPSVAMTLRMPFSF